MHMTLEADYAVRIVEYLAEHRRRTDAKTISETTEIPLRFSLKILRKLVSDEIVQSFKGAKGGYMLAKPAKDITLLEVIESVEGRYMLNRCQNSDYQCGRTSCNLHKIYHEISEEVRGRLAAHDFESLCGLGTDDGE